jgi:hypothetical protein
LLAALSASAHYVHAAKLHTLAIVERFDRIAAADDAAFLNPAIEARSIIQRQIDRQAKKFLEILAGSGDTPAYRSVVGFDWAVPGVKGRGALEGGGVVNFFAA